MRKLLKRIRMIINLAVNDFKAVYAGSALGSVWAIAEPLVTVAVYWFVYTIAFGEAEIDGIPYYIWLSVGISAWFFVSNGLRVTSAVFRDYSYLVKKMNFDKSLLPAVRVVSALLSHLIFLGIVIILCSAEKRSISIPTLMTAITLAILFVYALGRILALLCGIYKDVQNITAVILNIGFWLTPVFWQAEGIGKLMKIIYLNPVAVIVDVYRCAMLGGEFIGVFNMVYLLAFCGILLLIGSYLGRRILPDIADSL